MNNIKSLETVLSELSDEKKKRIESVANIQAIADELQFLVQQEVARKGRECTFDNYTMLHIRQVAEWIHKGQQRSLVLYGPYGVGKTIMLYALERYFCRHYADWRDDTREHFTASVTADNLCLLSTDPNNVDKIYCYKNCDILFIDDAGVEKEKYLCYGNPITPVADIIDHRYIRRKKTIFTTNLVPAELCSRYGERIADRMNEDYAFIMYSNHPSYR